jgi:hypothetical protein
MAFSCQANGNNFQSAGGEIMSSTTSLDSVIGAQGGQNTGEEPCAAGEIRATSSELGCASGILPTTWYLTPNTSGTCLTAGTSKLISVQQLVPVLVSENELAAAKAALCAQFSDMEMEIAEELVRVVLVDPNGSVRTAESLKTTLGQCDSLEARRSLVMLEDAHRTNKMAGLGRDELLLFVAIKSTKVHHERYTKNPHKSLFALLTGRSNNWWDTNHRRMLIHIAQKLHQKDVPKRRRNLRTRSEYMCDQMMLATQRRQRWQRENQAKLKCCYACQ